MLAVRLAVVTIHHTAARALDAERSPACNHKQSVRKGLGITSDGRCVENLRSIRG